MIQLIEPTTNGHHTNGKHNNRSFTDSDRGPSASEGAPAPAPISDNRRPEMDSDQPPSSSNSNPTAAPTTPRGGITPPTPSSTSSLRDSVSSSLLSNLLADYLYSNFNPGDLAFNHDLTLDELTEIIESDAFQSRVKKLRAIARQQAEDIIAVSLPASARQLVQIASFNPADGSLQMSRVRYLERECTRKASTAILRPLLAELRHKGTRTESEPLPSPPLVGQREGAGKKTIARRNEISVAHKGEEPTTRQDEKPTTHQEKKAGVDRAPAPTPVPDGGGLGRGSEQSPSFSTKAPATPTAHTANRGPSASEGDSGLPRSQITHPITCNCAPAPFPVPDDRRPGRGSDQSTSLSDKALSTSKAHTTDRRDGTTA